MLTLRRVTVASLLSLALWAMAGPLSAQPPKPAETYRPGPYYPPDQTVLTGIAEAVKELAVAFKFGLHITWDVGPNFLLSCAAICFTAFLCTAVALLAVAGRNRAAGAG